MNSGRLAVGSGRDASYRSSNGDLQPLQRIGLVFGGGADLVGRAAQCVLEERQQQLVLAVELQVEAA